jgi:hypothetical protein
MKSRACYDMAALINKQFGACRGAVLTPIAIEWIEDEKVFVVIFEGIRGEHPADPRHHQSIHTAHLKDLILLCTETCSTRSGP